MEDYVRAELKKVKDLSMIGYIGEFVKLANLKGLHDTYSIRGTSSTQEKEDGSGNIALSDLCTNVQQMNDECTPEIDIEIEKEKEKNKEGGDGLFSKIVQAFQNNGFGLINQGTKDILVDLIETYSSEWVIEALEISVLANVRRLDYTIKILQRWKAEGKNTGKNKKVDGPYAGVEAC